MRKPWNRGGFRTYLILVALVAGKVQPPWILASAPFLAAGIVVRLWAKGCLHQKAEVTKSGPYRFVRHPFYLGNLMIDFAIALMSGWPILICLFPLWWMAVYIPTMRREEREMIDLFGEIYKEYMSRVPLLVPTFKPLPPQPGFSWRNPNIVKTEIPRCLRFLSYPFLFLFWSEFHFDRFFYTFRVSELSLWSLMLFLLFNTLAWQVKSLVRGKNLWCWRLALSTKIRRIFFGLYASIGALAIYLFADLSQFSALPGVILLLCPLVASYKIQSSQVLADAGLIFGVSILSRVPWLCIPVLPVLVTPPLIFLLVYSLLIPRPVWLDNLLQGGTVTFLASPWGRKGQFVFAAIIGVVFLTKWASL